MFWSRLNRDFFCDKLIIINLVVSLILNLVIWLVLYFRLSFLQAVTRPIPLHYNVYFGIDLVGEWSLIFILPAVGFFIGLINIFLAYYIFQEKKMLSYLLTVSSTFIQIFIIMAASVVIWLNT